MALWIAVLIVLILLALALTVWIVWRAGKSQYAKEQLRRRTGIQKASSKKPPSDSGSTSLGQNNFKLAKSLRSLFKSSEIGSQTWEEIKDALILSDMGVELSAHLTQTAKSRTNSASTPHEALEILCDELTAVLSGSNDLSSEGSPAVWLIVGVNGSGKTTSLAKLAHQEIESGKKVVLAAADTFRAAAIDQLEQWSNRLEAGFVKGQPKGDSSAVVFDAVEHAKARQADLVLVDTAGRLHTNSNLMMELEKIKSTAEKAGGRVAEVLLTIDATTGQNGLVQAKEFTASAGVTGILLTKLDGSTKGGIAAAIVQNMGIPIKRVGVGEDINSLISFSAREFAQSLVLNV